MRQACELGLFGRMHTTGRATDPTIDHSFRYRPYHNCSAFLRSAAAHTLDLWHPVKERSCWARYLDACNATGCHLSVDDSSLGAPSARRRRRPRKNAG